MSQAIYLLDDDTLCGLLDDCGPSEGVELSYQYGAAAAFGLIGMAEAIHRRWTCRWCSEVTVGKYCQLCGAFLR